MTVIISSTYLLSHLRKVDFNENAIMSIEKIDSDTIKINLEDGEIEIYGVSCGESHQTHFDLLGCDFKNLIAVLKTIPDQPITLYFGSHLQMKMMF